MKSKHLGAWIAVCIAIASVGCNKEKGGAAVSEKAPALAVESSKTTQPVAAALPYKPNLSDAKLAAVEFFDKLGGGRPEAIEFVSISLRKQATSQLVFSEEKRLGYSDSDTMSYLRKQFTAGASARIESELHSPNGNEAEFRGVLTGSQPKSFALQMVSESGRWLVSRFFATDKLQLGTLSGQSNPELAWARESALDFLQSWVGGEREYYLVPMALMTNDMKSRLPSPTVHDEGLSFARKDVRNWLNQNRAGVKGFLLTKQSLEGGTAVFEGDLVSSDKSRPFRLVMKTEMGQWMVDACELK